MIVYAVDVRVVPGKEEDFKKATAENHNGTRKESGNLRFDLVQSLEDPSRFMLYEVYLDDQAVTAHKETAHYKSWRVKVEPWMASKREGHKFSSCLPVDGENW